MESDEEAASTPDGLRIERARYAQVWSDIDAARFETDGHYAWMAERLDDHQAVCEIGVGDGRSTVELLRRGHVVVGVDENPSCLHLARTRIAAQGFPVALISRETVRATRDGYSITYAPIAAARPSEGALLIEGDTKNDPQLLNWLARQHFDGVAGWLLGTHQSRAFNAALERENLRTAQGYKLSTLAGLYKWSDSILGPGGVLSIVDRGRGSTDPRLIEDACDGLRGAYGELAKGTALVVDRDIQMRPYALPEGTMMVLTSANMNAAISETVPVLFSVVARKPA